MRRFMFLMITLLPGLALGAGFDGKSSLLCAPEEAYECDEAEDCIDIDDDNLGLADFLEVDFKKNLIRAAGVDEGEYDESVISSVQTLESGLLLQGSEYDLAWSLSISAETGRMVLAVAGLDHGFVVFGVCAPR